MPDASNSGEKQDGRDYKDTLFLPTTDFPMRAGLPKREPELLARWARLDLYRTLRAASKDRDAVGIEWDAEFHRLLAYATGNSLIGDLIDYVMTATGQERQVTLSQRGGTAQAAKGHRDVVNAIEAGDAAEAEAAMRAHLKDAQIYVRRAFRQKAAKQRDGNQN